MGSKREVEREDFRNDFLVKIYDEVYSDNLANDSGDDSSSDYSDENVNFEETDNFNKKKIDVSKIKSSERRNKQEESKKLSSFQPKGQLFKQFEDKINFGFHDHYENFNRAANELKAFDRKKETNRVRNKDKHDRATAEQVMDPRTRMILFKLLNRGIITEINGCISTGKEANVYHCITKSDEEYAIKIYKTSILIFKDRDKYVTGEFRFRHGYSRHNPRKMVQTWAEKEMRNLLRLCNNNIPCPKPIILRSHVLVMEFIGKNGWPAPKLKDINVNIDKFGELYRDCVVIMWKIYNLCKLVHADLSEYNILYYNSTLIIIDVSQSVEHDHPSALEFLKKDCININDFFKKKGVGTMTVKALFEFITNPLITIQNINEHLDAIAKNIETEKESNFSKEVDEKVFENIFIPKRLDEVKTTANIDSGIEITSIINKMVNLSTNNNMPKSGDTSAFCDTDQSELESDNDETENNDDTSQNEKKFKSSARPRDESPNSKKARKQKVKEIQAEKRKTKIKKHLKRKSCSSNK
ncbi:serine/threonine-protein kinase rio1 [Condylostylus longicornis]|uniref:serine/threonine-protein kinase rio1 n=1 Tax=Condylostylus longicornis TaxID=2530218 RepID=UPI00244DF945|nr:serine/threonine-protein kinase rio1 [Condylostylus longicornis]